MGSTQERANIGAYYLFISSTPILTEHCTVNEVPGILQSSECREMITIESFP